MNRRPTIIAPSLLAADPGHFAKAVARADKAQGDWLHLDIMDGHFVPNISFGPDAVGSLRPLTKLFFDVHLMCSRPDVLLAPFAEAGADSITVHIELGDQVASLLWKIKSLGLKTGVAINPATSMAVVEPYLDRIDLLLLMTVNPGFGGQSFMTEVLPKIQQAESWRRSRKLDYHVQVDGGINNVTAAECARSGANAFVSGTSLFRRRNLKAAVRQMRRGVEEAARNRSQNGG